MAKITIDIPDEMYNEMIRISKELKIQDNRGTADPYFYQVMTYKEYPTSSDYSSNSDYINQDGWKIEWYDFLNSKDDFKRYLEDQWYDEDDILEYLLDYDKKEDNYELEEWLEEEFYIRYVYYLKEEHLENVFLTESAIKKHIENNKHNYPDEVFNYVNYAYRNPELETVIKFIKSLTDNK